MFRILLTVIFSGLASLPFRFHNLIGSAMRILVFCVSMTILACCTSAYAGLDGFPKLYQKILECLKEPEFCEFLQALNNLPNSNLDDEHLVFYIAGIPNHGALVISCIPDDSVTIEATPAQTPTDEHKILGNQKSFLRTGWSHRKTWEQRRLDSSFESRTYPGWLYAKGESNFLGTPHCKKYTVTSRDLYEPGFLARGGSRSYPVCYLRLRVDKKDGVRILRGQFEPEDCYLSISKPFDEFAVEFLIFIGTGELDTLEDIVNQNQEYPLQLETMLDGNQDESSQDVIDTEQALTDYIEAFEQFYDPDNPLSHPMLDQFCGNGISSQVFYPIHRYRSLVFKRFHKPCADLSEAKQVVNTCLVNNLLVKLIGIPFYPIAFLIVKNHATGEFVIYGVQRRIPVENLTSTILGDPDADMEAKKLIIDEIIKILQECDVFNREQAKYAAEKIAGFQISLDPNVSNFALIDGQLWVLDLQPSFWAIDETMAPGNQYLLSLFEGFEEHLRALCLVPTYRFDFMLTMIKRIMDQHELKVTVCQSRQIDCSHSERLAENWRNVYQYALSAVMNIPHVAMELSYTPLPDGVNSFQELRFATEKRLDIAKNQLTRTLSTDGIMDTTLYLATAIEQLVSAFPQEAAAQELGVETHERKKSAPAFLMEDRNTVLSHHIDSIKENRKKLKPNSSQGKAGHKKEGSHISGRIKPASIVLNDREMEQYLKIKLNLRYIPSSRVSNRCFWEALESGLNHWFGHVQDWDSEDIQRRLEAEKKSLVFHEKKIFQVMMSLYSENARLENTWIEYDDIPIILRILKSVYKIDVRILLIMLNEDMNPVGYFQYLGVDGETVIFADPIHDPAAIAQIGSQQGVITIVSHLTGTYDSFSDQHWGGAIPLDESGVLPRVIPETGSRSHPIIIDSSASHSTTASRSNSIEFQEADTTIYSPDILTQVNIEPESSSPSKEQSGVVAGSKSYKRRRADTVSSTTGSPDESWLDNEDEEEPRSKLPRVEYSGGGSTALLDWLGQHIKLHPAVTVALKIGRTPLSLYQELFTIALDQLMRQLAEAYTVSYNQAFFNPYSELKTLLPRMMLKQFKQVVLGDMTAFHEHLYAVLDWIVKSLPDSNAFMPGACPSLLIVQPTVGSSETEPRFSVIIISRRCVDLDKPGSSKNSIHTTQKVFRYNLSVEDIIELMNQPNHFSLVTNTLSMPSGHYIEPVEGMGAANWWWVTRDSQIITGKDDQGTELVKRMPPPATPPPKVILRNPFQFGVYASGVHGSTPGNGAQGTESSSGGASGMQTSTTQGNDSDMGDNPGFVVEGSAVLFQDLIGNYEPDEIDSILAAGLWLLPLETIVLLKRAREGF